MPIFEYICRDCHHQFETIVRAGNSPACPSCRSEHLQKQLSVFAVNTKSNSGSTSQGIAACGTCGDPRGPGSCSMN